MFHKIEYNWLGEIKRCQDLLGHDKCILWSCGSCIPQEPARPGSCIPADPADGGMQEFPAIQGARQEPGEPGVGAGEGAGIRNKGRVPA